MLAAYGRNEIDAGVRSACFELDIDCPFDNSCKLLQKTLVKAALLALIIIGCMAADGSVAGTAMGYVTLGIGIGTLLLRYNSKLIGSGEPKSGYFLSIILIALGILGATGTLPAVPLGWTVIGTLIAYPVINFGNGCISEARKRKSYVEWMQRQDEQYKRECEHRRELEQQDTLNRSGGIVFIGKDKVYIPPEEPPMKVESSAVSSSQQRSLQNMESTLAAVNSKGGVLDFCGEKVRVPPDIQDRSGNPPSRRPQSRPQEEHKSREPAVESTCISIEQGIPPLISSNLD